MPLDDQKRRRVLNLIQKELSHIENNKLQIETSIEYARYQLEKFKEQEDRNNNRELVPIQERKLRDFENIREVYDNEIKLLEEIKRDIEEK